MRAEREKGVMRERDREWSEREWSEREWSERQREREERERRKEMWIERK